MSGIALHNSVKAYLRVFFHKIKIVFFLALFHSPMFYTLYIDVLTRTHSFALIVYIAYSLEKVPA